MTGLRRVRTMISMWNEEASVGNSGDLAGEAEIILTLVALSSLATH